MTQLGRGLRQRAAQRWRERSRRSRTWHVLTTLGVLGLLAALIGMFAYYWTPGSVVLLACAAVAPYLSVGAVVAAALFAVSRGITGWIGFGVSCAVVVWSVAVQAPLFVASSVPAGRDVVVMTANLRLGNADPDAIVQAVRSHDVEVLMLEELTPPELDALQRAGLAKLLPYGKAEPRWNAAGSALLSRYPVSDWVVRPDFEFAFVQARVHVPGLDPAPTMVALHVYGPYPQSATGQWATDLARLPNVLRDVPRDAPVIVGGDFNASRDIAQFRDLLQGGYADAADQAGAGFTPTYPANRLVPLVAIDHVLTRSAVAHTADSISLPGSDHRGLIATVRLP